MWRIIGTLKNLAVKEEYILSRFFSGRECLNTIPVIPYDEYFVNRDTDLLWSPSYLQLNNSDCSSSSGSQKGRK